LLVRSYSNQAEQQTEKRKKWAHVRAQYSLESGQVCSTQEHFVLPLRSSEFFSVFMTGDNFVFSQGNFPAVIPSLPGLKKVVHESQRIGWCGKPYIRR